MWLTVEHEGNLFHIQPRRNLAEKRQKAMLFISHTVVFNTALRVQFR